ncbi:hypothetical protein PRN20_21680 [Devosia sp. ZB163]|uniref:hypothetical protein n=1 Tax=Devosia sp. ZB163 TaxID=3025938 RepID=UPI00235FD289|nr:hypothetical protein [Devosia sp. ZB163]MDC9826354.1 hypothetical protein [Devosia sp. ZB163]
MSFSLSQALAETRLPDVPPTMLTTADYFTLQALELPATEDRDHLAAFLRRKLSTATVAFPADIGADIATIGSELHYVVGQRSEKRVLVPGRTDEAERLFVGSQYGLALVGMRSGQSMQVAGAGGELERLELVSIRRAA